MCPNKASLPLSHSLPPSLPSFPFPSPLLFPLPSVCIINLGLQACMGDNRLPSPVFTFCCCCCCCRNRVSGSYQSWPWNSLSSPAGSWTFIFNLSVLPFLEAEITSLHHQVGFKPFRLLELRDVLGSHQSALIRLQRFLEIPGWREECINDRKVPA